MSVRPHLLCFAWVLALLSCWTAEASAQHPKLDLSLFVGLNTSTFVPRAEGMRKADTYPGFEMGGGLRVRRRKAFVSTALTFRAWGVVLEAEQVDEAGAGSELVGTDVISLSLECPWLIGYIPYKDPYFKVFLYGGYVNQFNLRFLIDVPGQPTQRVNPRDVSFAIYQALMRFGVGFDVTLFHFNFAYSVGLNSATRTDTRTNVQLLQFDLGILF